MDAFTVDHHGLMSILLFLAVLLAMIVPLGWYMAQVYEGRIRFLKSLERVICRWSGAQASLEMDWKGYLSAVLISNLLMMLIVYAVQRLQMWFPWNSQHLANLSPDLAFSIAAGFIASADWQVYNGEGVISYFNQMTALSIVKFIAGASGMCVAVAVFRGLFRTDTDKIGNFWLDLIRSVLYILLPLSFIMALFLSSQGVVQSMRPYQTVDLIQPLKTQNTIITQQVLPLGPVASSMAIQQLSVNGGGNFNVNNAHPFENPSPVTNFVELVTMLLIPGAFCVLFGLMVHDRRQGLAVLLAMLLMFIPALFVTVHFEQAGNPLLSSNFSLESGANMEGKETRFGATDSAIYLTASTASASGSNNAMLDSFMPLGTLACLWLIHTGEVVFGGLGSGLYGMIMLIVLAVFIAGLLVGRTPEYLGKKINAYDMKMAAFAILIMPLLVLFFTALTVVIPAGLAAMGNPGAHGFTEILYAYTSMTSTNGGSMAGINANTPFFNTLGGFLMLIGRYWTLIPAMALAGSFVKKKRIPEGVGTLATYTPLFIILLVAVILILGALTFFPAVSLGPIAEYLLLKQ